MRHAQRAASRPRGRHFRESFNPWPITIGLTGLVALCYFEAGWIGAAGPALVLLGWTLLWRRPRPAVFIDTEHLELILPGQTPGLRVSAAEIARADYLITEARRSSGDALPDGSVARTADALLGLGAGGKHAGQMRVRHGGTKRHWVLKLEDGRRYRLPDDLTCDGQQLRHALEDWMRGHSIEFGGHSRS